MIRIQTLATALSASLVLLTAVPRPAGACGGCFHAPDPPPLERSVVTAHRMAFSITPRQTVLWDQIRYSGDPTEFAWVLPVRGGARVELSHDEWFAALDASTQPIVVPPPTLPQSGVGCGLAACGASSSDGTAAGSTGSVQVLGQNVVGPYETATLRSRDSLAIQQWLVGHGFAIPDSVRPVVDAYVAEGFDFIALRLRPQCGERAMRPVRVVTPGADPTLPLRMVAAGAGSVLDVVLYIIGEGRWRTRNFSEVLLDDTQIRWDPSTDRSNYEELAQGLMASGGGASWLTESARRPDLYGWYFGHPEASGLAAVGNGATAQTANGSAFNPGLARTYFAFCRGRDLVPGTTSPIAAALPCAPTAAGNEAGADDARADVGAGDASADVSESLDARVVSSSDGDLEASTDADLESSVDGDLEASTDGNLESSIDAQDEAMILVSEAPSGAPDASDGSPAQASTTVLAPDPCSSFDDMDVALAGAHPQDVWVTRLRARLPLAALANDLFIEASPSQGAVSNVHYAPLGPAARPTQSCAAAPRPDEAFGASLLVAGTIWGVGAIFRRRRR